MSLIQSGDDMNRKHNRWVDFINGVRRTEKCEVISLPFIKLLNKGMFDVSVSESICSTDKSLPYKSLKVLTASQIKHKLWYHKHRYLSQTGDDDDFSFIHAATFIEVNLSGFDFTGFALQHVEFLYCNLRGCTFDWENMDRVTFKECIL